MRSEKILQKLSRGKVAIVTGSEQQSVEKGIRSLAARKPLLLGDKQLEFAKKDGKLFVFLRAPVRFVPLSEISRR